MCLALCCLPTACFLKDLLQPSSLSITPPPPKKRFYFAINVGSLVATLVVVPVQEAKGYALGFGIPTILMACAIGVLLLGAAGKL
jgi:dipeptide/tripeptide permease